MPVSNVANDCGAPGCSGPPRRLHAPRSMNRRMLGRASRRASRKSSVGPAISKMNARSYTPSATGNDGSTWPAGEPALQETAIDRLHLRRELLARAAASHALRRGVPEPAPELRVVQEAPDGLGERRRVRIRDEQAGRAVLHRILAPDHAGADHGDTHRHGLEKDE